MNSYLVIREFWEENDLMNDSSHIHFNCTFKIKTQSNSSTSENKAMIWVDSGSTNKVQILDFKKDVRKYPTDFWLSTCIFTMDKNVLTITGKHPNPKIGRYRAVITAHGKI